MLLNAVGIPRLQVGEEVKISTAMNPGVIAAKTLSDYALPVRFFCFLSVMELEE